MTRRWYQFRAQARGAPEIVIYDEIGAFGIPAKAFRDELKALGPVIFVVQGEPERRDPDRLVWTLDTRPI